MTETAGPTMPEVFTTWPFTENKAKCLPIPVLKCLFIYLVKHLLSAIPFQSVNSTRQGPVLFMDVFQALRTLLSRLWALSKYPLNG